MVSSVPESLLEFDEHFSQELESVNVEFFSNIEQPDLADDSDESTDSESENDVTVPLELREVDREENDVVRSFEKNGCGCKKIHGKPCSQVIDLAQAVDYRRQCQEMTRDELDLTVKVQLSAHRKNLSTAALDEKRKTKERERPSQTFYSFGTQVCKRTFLFLHYIGKKRLKNISTSLDNDGLKPRVHGLVGQAGKHAITLKQTEQIVTFLKNYAASNGLPLPGRLPNHKKDSAIILSSDNTKSDIHILYNKAANENNMRCISLSEFKKIWLQQCPHIVISKPATDLCDKCQRFAHKISTSGNLPEEEKADLLQQYTVHLEKAACQRDSYRAKCEAAKLSYAAMTPEQKLRGNHT